MSSNSRSSVTVRETSSVQSPLQGLNVNFSSAQTLASTMDNMSRQVHLVNFAYVKLNQKDPLGQGSFSRVYRYFNVFVVFVTYVL